MKPVFGAAPASHMGWFIAVGLLLACRSPMLQSKAIAGTAETVRSATYAEIMPRVEDFTHMWWANGFPGHTRSAPWRRSIQTGHFAMALDTQRMRIPHWGAAPGGLSYLEAARDDQTAWQRMPPADLELSIRVAGKTYRCSAGGRWSNTSGPRVIESGRFMQRADVTDLIFTAKDGARLNVEARFETVAWPDRLALILAARPGRIPIPAGEDAFGRIGGGFEFDGTNHLDEWNFRPDIRAAATQPRERWEGGAMEIRLKTPQGLQRQRREFTSDEDWTDWREVFVALYPEKPGEGTGGVTVQAEELLTGIARRVDFDPARGWHRINLDGIDPIVPPGGPERQNDAIERVKLVLTNRDTSEHVVRLLFEKNGAGIRLPIGAPITGVSAMLRDVNGHPTGLPVQLSKNWHTRPDGGVYAGVWFHGFSQVRLPASAMVELELTLAYGHWGGVAAASHAQLSLIGWGSNQLWDQSALGAWGESICYEPDQAQAHAAILDARPLMVHSMHGNQPWHWTHNVGGGDFFRLFDGTGKRIFPARMRTAYQRQGPCLTEVTYAGQTGRAIEHTATVSISRTDDIVRGTYRLRMDVKRAFEFSRFVIFQLGADTYSYTGERKMALGNETGLIREWDSQWGGDMYRMQPMECAGRIPWISLHEAVPRGAPDQQGAWANRGVVIRSWEARLGGRAAGPWMAERGVNARGVDTSTVDLVPPPGVTRLVPGDFVEAIIEYIVMPQFAKDYYGPNGALRAALRESGNTWKMIHREAVGNHRRVEMKTGELEGLYPSVQVRAVNDQTEFTLAGGLGYVPVTFSGLSTHAGHALYVNGQTGDQSVHGNDFWQTDYDPVSGTWEVTFNIPASGAPIRVALARTPP
jgi:hypothetical protein